MIGRYGEMSSWQWLFDELANDYILNLEQPNDQLAMAMAIW